ncbi:hypothetical protein GN958_ATG21909 [Phytophthora infestans]|uniref:Uncharacterized protein n=1 Tax=Phytophthora infestans TaxID=4787 RepID=A0A8S9TKQ5_PHYIN|nr:hypothetical protein GN958_ATG21909 [Phytophthora infestans]
MAASTQRVSVIATALDDVAPATLTLVDQEPFPVICQICMDAPSSVFQLCGAECLAEVCGECLCVSIYSIRTNGSSSFFQQRQRNKIPNNLNKK